VDEEGRRVTENKHSTEIGRARRVIENKLSTEVGA